MIAKRGDSVCLKHQFRIVSYSLEKETILVDLLNADGNTIGQELLPLYLSELAILPKEIAFVVPGDHNELDHPDYYQVVSLENKSKRVLYNNKHYQLRLSPDFNYTGEYMLLNEDTGELINKKARKTTNKFIKDILDSASKHTLQGKIVKGTVVIFYYIDDENKSIFVDAMDISHNSRLAQNKRSVIIHDIHSNIEYDLPVNLITLG